MKAGVINYMFDFCFLTVDVYASLYVKHSEIASDLFSKKSMNIEYEYESNTEYEPNTNRIPNTNILI